MLGFFLQVLYKIFPNDQNSNTAAKHALSKIYMYPETILLFIGHNYQWTTEVTDTTDQQKLLCELIISLSSKNKFDRVFMLSAPIMSVSTLRITAL